MKNRTIIPIIAFILLVQTALALGSLQTLSMQPVRIDLCADNVQYATITAAGIVNKETVQLTGVTANLHITGNSGLYFVTSQSISLGDIPGLSQSSINPSWVVQCASPVEGVYSAYVNYTSANGYTASSIDEAVTILTVFSNAPINANSSVVEGEGTVSTNQEVPIINDNTPTIIVTTNKNSLCKGSLDNDESYADMDFVFYGTEKDHNYTFASPMSDGEHVVYSRCKDFFNNIMSYSVESRFIVDAIAPEITVRSIVNINEDYTYINISTSEDAECRFSEGEDDDFEDMSEFESTSPRIFTAYISDLAEGKHVIFVRCRDNAENSAEKEVNLNVDISPTAKITLSDPTPVKEGLIEVKLVPSKPLRSAPQLSYSFTDSTTFARDIPLTKVGDHYIGTLLIERSDNTRIGVFSFEGYDLNGNRGKEITNGKDFVVDTVKPPKPAAFDISANEDGEIELRWYYEGEKEDSFRIYRSIEPGVSLIDFYDETYLSEYTDDDVENGYLYYYRVIAVDLAGNLGEMSDELSAASSKEGAIHMPKQDIPKYTTLVEYNKSMKDVEKLEIDINWAEANLNEQKAKESAVDDLNLIKKVMDSKSEIAKIKNQFRNIDLSTYTDNDLKDLISRTRSLMQNLQKTTPQKLVVDKRTDFLQSTTESDVDLVIDEVTRGLNYSEKDMKKYRQKNYDIIDEIKVAGIVKTLTIEYLSGDTQSRVIISKEVNYESPDKITDIKIAEVIPKTVAADLSSVDVFTPDYVIIKEDPIIGWNMPELTYDKFSIKYLIMTDDLSESAKNTKTIVIFRPDDQYLPKTSLVTGFSVLIANISPFGVMQTLGIFLGLAIVIGLLMYYLVYIKEVDVKGFYNKGLERLPFKIELKKKGAIAKIGRAHV